MIKFNNQSEKNNNNNKTQLNRINLNYSSKKQKKILNLKQRCNIYISPKIERKRERETIFFVKKNYAYNGKENAKFILKG